MGGVRRWIAVTKFRQDRSGLQVARTGFQHFPALHRWIIAIIVVSKKCLIILEQVMKLFYLINRLP